MATKKTTSAHEVTVESAFLQGRNLAVQMVRTIKDEGEDACCIERRTNGLYLLGAQSSTVAGYLKRIAAQPELAQGFAAVLTDLLCTDGALDLDYIGSLTAEDMGVAESTDGHGFARFMESATGQQTQG